jgi:tetratricopeptide (TPR) repeat protein
LATVGYDIPEDGGDDATFSSSAEVQKFMQKGEDLFAKGSYDEAIEQYQAALSVDPKLYSAALFIGDTYFKKQDYRQANEWFLRAVTIDPNIETAHRYWGDSLMKSSQSEQARDQYIDAIIAEPYNRRSWFGLINWANAEKKILSHPALRIPVKLENGAKPGDVNITLDSDALDKKDNNGAVWVAYSLARAAWRGDKFQKNFPQEKQYRHSLAEEVDSFNLALSVAKETKAKDNDKDLELIRRLSQKGLLEAFILISRPDEGVAQDYAAYRKDHRAQLRQYIQEYLISK